MAQDLKKYIHEIVEEAEKLKTIKERKEYLRQFKNRKALKGLLQISYDKNIKILLPDTDPPYKPSEMPEGMTDTRIDHELRRFWVFIKGGPYDDMNQTKRESIFLEILQGLHKKEAEIFLRAFQHKWRIKGLRAEHINEIFDLNIPTPAKKKTSNKVDTNA